MKKRVLKAFVLCAVATMLSVGICACSDQSKHELTLQEAKDATCTEAGNEAYYVCSHCDKIFKDADGQTETTLDEVRIAPLGHTVPESEHHESVPADCETDGNFEYWHCTACGKNFADAACTLELTDTVDKAFHMLNHIEAHAPTFDCDGNSEAYKCGKCGKYFTDARGQNETTAQDIVLQKLPQYGVTLSASLATGDTITGKTVRFTLCEAEFEKEYSVTATEGSELGTLKMGAGKYFVSVDGGGYYSTFVTVGKNSSTLSVPLDKVEHTVNKDADAPNIFYGLRDENGKHTLVFDAASEADSTGFMSIPSDKMTFVAIKDSALDAKYYYAEFTMRADPFVYPGAWYSRFYICALQKNGTKNIGCTFIHDDIVLWLDECHGDKNDTQAVKLDGKNGKINSAEMITAIGSENGCKFRVIRSGENVYISVFLNGSWKIICAFEADLNDVSELAFSGLGSNIFYFSDFEFATYTAQKDPDTENDGFEAHYEFGNKKYDLQGRETTDAELKLEKLQEIEVTINATRKLAGTVLDGEEDVTVQFVSQQGIRYEKTLAGNSLTFKMAKGIYQVSIEGYDDAELVIGDETTYSITLYKKQYALSPLSGGTLSDGMLRVERDNNENPVYKLQADWTGNEPAAAPYVTISDSKISGTKYVIDFTLSANDNWAEVVWNSRFYMTFASGQSHEKPIGIVLTRCKDSNEKALLAQYRSGYEWTGTYTELKNMNWADAFIAAVGSPEGVQLRIVRLDGAVSLFAKLDGAWVKLYSVETEATAAAQFGFAAAGIHTYTVKGISIANAYTDAKSPSIEEAGNVAYFTLNDNTYLSPNGEVLTDVTVPKLAEQTVEVTVTVTRFGTAFTDSAVLDSIKLLLAHENGVSKYSDVTIVNGKLSVTKLYKGIYTVTNNRNFDTVTFTVGDEGTARLELTMTNRFVELADDGNMAQCNADNVVFTLTGSNIATVKIIDENVYGDMYAAEFTVTAPNWNAYTSRFAIGLADAGNNAVNGFGFFDAEGYIATQPYKPSDNFNGDWATTDVAIGRSKFRENITGGSGLRFRVVRNSGTIVLYVKCAGEETWTQLLVQNGITGGTRLTFAACSIGATGTITLSDVTVSGGTLTRFNSADQATVALGDSDIVSASAYGVTFNLTNSAKTATVALFDDSVYENDYSAEFTVKITGWNAYTLRFGIGLTSTEQNVANGFGYFYPETVSYQFYQTSGNFDGSWNQDSPISYPGFYAAITGEGLKFRAVRTGGTVTLYAWLNNQWTLLQSESASGTPKLTFAVRDYGGGVTTSPVIEFSDISIITVQ